MISNAQQKLIQSLTQKKYRKKNKLFLAEGVKIVNEILFSAYKIHSIFGVADWLADNSGKLHNTHIQEIVEVDEKELKKISNLRTANKVLAVVHMPEQDINLNSNLIIMLDSIRDPGNMGTIIRIADWYGIDTIICSEDCADIYNPKVIQASMGSFLRIQHAYENLQEILSSNSDRNSYGAFLEGESVHTCNFQKPAFLLIGNESNGIQKELQPLIKQKISIPKFGEAESLNASVATAIILDNMRRKLNVEC